MRALMNRRSRWQVAALLGLALGVPGVLRAEDAPPPTPVPAPDPVPAPPPHPFVAWASEVTPGTPIRGPGLVLVPLLREVEKQQVVEGARVGLHEVFVDVMDLPAPAGGLYVRLNNRSEHPVEVTVGEALVTPDGPSRVILRGAYLPPQGSAFVPTARGMVSTPRGPYVTRGLGLAPREQALLETDRWPAELTARNQQFAVEPTRHHDASAAFLTESFQVQAAPYEPRLEPLRSPRCVGVAVFDERGLAFARICADAARFQANLVFLGRELLLDALRHLAAGRMPRDAGDALLRAEVRNVLEALRDDGKARQGFCGAAHHRWEVPGRNARWEGLSVAGEPWSLTWRMAAAPVPVAPAPVQPPTPPQPPPVPDDPTPNEVDRKSRPSPFEDRWRDRRPEPPAGGGSTPGGGGSAPGGGGHGLGGGLR